MRALKVLLLVPFVKLSYDSLSGLWYHLESDLPRKVLPSPGAVILVMFALAVCWLLAVYVVCGVMRVFGFVCEQSASWAEKIPRSALLMSLQKVNVESELLYKPSPSLSNKGCQVSECSKLTYSQQQFGLR